MKYVTALTISLCYLTSNWAIQTQVDSKESSILVNSSWQELVEYAQENLPMEGKLMINRDGFCYVKVVDDYIHKLFPKLDLQKEGFRKPPYFRTDQAPGAHISVFYGRENVFPEEIGQDFHFKLKQIVIVKVSRDTSYAVLLIESQELEKLREKYGLSPKLQGYEFHISLAKRTKAFKGD